MILNNKNVQALGMFEKQLFDCIEEEKVGDRVRSAGKRGNILALFLLL